MATRSLGILKERDEVSLNGLLESTDGRALERGSDLKSWADQTLEGELPDQELSGLLVATDLTESDSTWRWNVRKCSKVD